MKFILYVRKLLHKWYVYLAIVPSIYDFSSAYFNVDFKIPSSFLYIFGVIAFLYASYSVWEDEKKEKDALIKSMANPVDYRLIAELTPIDIEEENQLNKFDNNVIKAQESIKSVKLEIESLGDDKFIQYAMALRASNDSLISYRNKLLKYIDDLTIYIEKSNEYKNQYIEKIKTISNRYFIVFNIENIGSKSDSQINIEIKTQQNNFIDAKNMYDLVFRNIPTLPLKPESPLQQLAKSFDFLNTTNPQYPFDNPIFFATKTKFDDKNALIIIKEMNVGKIEDTSKEKMFIELLDKSDFKVTIHSKESSAVIEKSLEVKVNNIAKKLVEHV